MKERKGSRGLLWQYIYLKDHTNKAVNLQNRIVSGMSNTHENWQKHISRNQPSVVSIVIVFLRKIPFVEK